MRLGRNFTNIFTFDVLTPQEQSEFNSGVYDMYSLNALGSVRFKEDVIYQLKLILKYGLNHLELDCDVPNPYPDFTKQKKLEIKKFAEDNDITLSIHLTYSNVGSSICSLQELDRCAAVSVQKEYIKFAHDIGALYATLHPGYAPFYMTGKLYVLKLKERLLLSVIELAKFCNDYGIKLHIENNTAFDNIFYELEDILEVLLRVKEQGFNVYLNFDIGHWFTRADINKPLPEDPISIMNKIPKEFVCELHLNNYIPVERIFHPPLIDDKLPLNLKNLEKYVEIVKKLNPEVIVLETAFKTPEQIKNRHKIVSEETQLVKRLFNLK